MTELEAIAAWPSDYEYRQSHCLICDRPLAFEDPKAWFPQFPHDVVCQRCVPILETSIDITTTSAPTARARVLRAAALLGTALLAGAALVAVFLAAAS